MGKSSNSPRTGKPTKPDEAIPLRIAFLRGSSDRFAPISPAGPARSRGALPPEPFKTYGLACKVRAALEALGESGKDEVENAAGRKGDQGGARMKDAPVRSPGQAAPGHPRQGKTTLSTGALESKLGFALPRVCTDGRLNAQRATPIAN